MESLDETASKEHEIIVREELFRNKCEVVRNLAGDFVTVAYKDLTEIYGDKILGSRGCLDTMYRYCENFAYTPDDCIFPALDNQFKKLLKNEKISLREAEKQMSRAARHLEWEENKTSAEYFEGQRGVTVLEQNNNKERLRLIAIDLEYKEFLQILDPLRWAFFRIHRTHEYSDEYEGEFETQFPERQYELDELVPSTKQLKGTEKWRRRVLVK